MRTHNLADQYDLPPLEWSSITERLDRDITQAPDTGGPNRHTCWLTTLDADGAPHTTGVGAQWVDGSWWFETGRGTRKGRNLERDPRCSLATALQEFDLVVQGTASVVTDPPTVARMAEVWASGGWPCRVDESGTALTAEFSAPSAGKPPGTSTGSRRSRPWHSRPSTPAARRGSTSEPYRTGAVSPTCCSGAEREAGSLRRQVPGDRPTWRLKARWNADSDW